MADVLTLNDAIHLETVLRAAQGNKRIEWLVDEERGLTCDGAARAITHEGGGFWPADADVRDGFLHVSGTFEYWLPVRELMDKFDRGAAVLCNEREPDRQDPSSSSRLLDAVVETITQETTTVKRLFTFGFGQVDPKTGRSLADRFVWVEADRSYVQCREQMLERFGRAHGHGNWAFDYACEDDAGVGRFPMIEIDFESGQDKRQGWIGVGARRTTHEGRRDGITQDPRR